MLNAQPLLLADTHEPNPDAAWVFDGLGHPSPLWEGVTTRIEGDDIFVEHVTGGRAKTPDSFVAAAELSEGTWGWIPLSDATATIKKQAAAALKTHGDVEPGLYELVGPNLARNPHELRKPILKPHGVVGLAEETAFAAPFPRNVNALAQWVRNHPGYLGVAWTRSDQPHLTAVLRAADIA